MKFGVFRLFKFSLGTVVLFGVTVAGLGGLNLYTYQRFTAETPAATLAFAKTGARNFQVNLVPRDGVAQSFVLAGESPLYRLDHISRRYMSIDEARANPQTMHPLAGDQGIFLPMGDGLLYDVSMSRTGLLARSVEPGGRQ